jgi:hypothetical protein
MTFGFGRGFGGGFGRGFGFRGSSPPWPYVGRGRGGLPRCWHPAAYPAPPYTPGAMPYPHYGEEWGPAYYGGAAAPGAVPYGPQMSRGEELEFLREEANAVKAQLDEIEARMKQLESEQE